jgi:hypothetical protein
MGMSPTLVLEDGLKACIAHSKSREELWIDFVRSCGVRRVAEIGVYRGDFAREVLSGCDGLTAYYMIDPWRQLSDWNKPANHEDAVLESYFRETKEKTEFAAEKRVILRGTTVEVADQIKDGELDFAYIDGDHTLKGIAIDLIRIYPKVRAGGFVGGDDFTSSIWEHKSTFEPTLVFPFAVYFAEAAGATIYALPYSQFCLHKTGDGQFRFVDLTGKYGDVGLRNQVDPAKLFKIAMWERFPRVMGAVRRIRDLFSR